MALTQVASGLIASVAASTITGTQTIPRGTLPTGSVLQVVNAITPSDYTTTSSSSTATGYGLSITPTSASSKILILIAGTMDTGVANNQSVISVRRGSTALGAGSGSNVFSAGGRMIGSLSVVFLDSPATTSSTTYNLYFQAGSSSTITWQSGATVTLIEISA